MPMTREEILGSPDLKVHEVEVPFDGWDVVSHREFSGADREMIAEKADEYEGIGQVYLLFVTGVVNGTGERIFTEDDIPALKTKKAEAVAFVVNDIIDKNGLSQLAVEDLEGNSGGAPSAEPGSD